MKGETARPSLAGIEPFSATPWSFQPWGDQNQNGGWTESILLDAHGEAIAYGLPNADGALTAAAPALLDAVRAALAVILPHWDTETRREKKSGRTGSACVCETCNIYRAITAHIDLGGERT